MNRIQLYNRYNEDNYLENIRDNIWALKLGNSNDWEHIRVGLRDGYTWDDNEYCFVDPPGGPFISLDGKIAGKTVTRIRGIYPGYEIYLEDEKKD